MKRREMNDPYAAAAQATSLQDSPADTPTADIGVVLETTSGLCRHCLRTVPAVIHEKDGAVHLRKCCPQHGAETVLLEEDAAYHRRKREYDKPGTASAVETAQQSGCPHDCGLCPQHRQHTCIGLLEVTGGCDLHCPVCYAAAGTGRHRDLSALIAAMDHFQEAEGGRAEILQISGGEPTTHPDILEIIAQARQRHFRYVMLNTNGLRIADDPAFVRELARFRGGFEIYLQFDGLHDAVHRRLRGRELQAVKERAVTALAAADLPITLVCTVEAGLNDDGLGELFLYGLRTLGVRGINFQPRAAFGRAPQGQRPALTISGLIRRLAAQTGGLLRNEDFIPLPCNVEGSALTYLYRRGGGFVPITRRARIREYLPLINNTFFFQIEEMLKTTGRELVHGRHVCDCLRFIDDFRTLVPLSFFGKSREARMEYVDENTFRLSITRFVDADNFHTRAMQKECVHILGADGRRIPFSAYNLLHRRHEE